MSDSDEVVINKRRTNRLNLDSEEEARVEAEEQQRLEDVRLRKEEKRRKRDEEVRLAQQEQERRKQLEIHYQDPLTMIEPDSDSNDHFERIERKIQRAYPDIKMPKEMNRKRRMVSESDQSGSDSDQQGSSGSDSESGSESEEVPKKKQIKKQVKREKNDRKREERAEEMRARHKAKEVKVEEKDPKQTLVGEVAVRWWYCLPEWPPVDFNYQAALRKQGYRLISPQRFRVEQNLENGLLKATPIDGFVGVYKAKQKLVDVRPKDDCPTLNFLRAKTAEELTSLLRQALKVQLKELNDQNYKTADELELETKLARRLGQIS